jgi:hypothetical protein
VADRWSAGIGAAARLTRPKKALVRRMKASEYVRPDGVMGEPDRASPYLGIEIMRAQARLVMEQ